MEFTNYDIDSRASEPQKEIRESFILGKESNEYEKMNAQLDDSLKTNELNQSELKFNIKPVIIKLVPMNPLNVEDCKTPVNTTKNVEALGSKETNSGSLHNNGKNEKLNKFLKKQKSTFAQASEKDETTNSATNSNSQKSNCNESQRMLNRYN